MAALGILGGTFDPVHWGHLILAEQAWEQLELDKVVFVPAGDPPHKAGEPVTAAEHRFEMTLRAIANNVHFECSRIELDRPGPSYTVDTLRSLQSLYRDADLFLLIGADEARDLMTWREPYVIQKLARIIVANRPGVSLDEALGVLPEDFAAGIVRLEIPGVDLSSTRVRERASAGRSIRYLVPNAVEEYIRSMGIYEGKR